MRKLLNIGAGPIRLENFGDLECENSDFADTESAKGWKLDKLRDFTKPMSDLENDSIDYIVAWHILEHMGFPTERNEIIAEWKRVLKPGGKIFLACPDLSKIARHIIDRDGPWADWFICSVNVYGPYNGFIGDLHRWAYNYDELVKLFKDEHQYSDCHELTPGSLMNYISIDNAQKLGFAEYNAQVEITK